MNTRHQYTQNDVNFFYGNAGYSYDPASEQPEDGRWRCARKLAEAEATAINNGWYAEWEEDQEPCIGCDCGSDDCPCALGTEHQTLTCVLYGTVGGVVLASLCGICEPSRESRRVIEAELAEGAISSYGSTFTGTGAVTGTVTGTRNA